MFLRNWARLYTRQTKAEEALEHKIAKTGVRYRTQYPIFKLSIIADFAFPDLRILLEVDGKSHESEAAKAKDRARDQKTAELGWRTIRVSNQQALEAESEDVAAWLGLDSKS